MLFLPALSFRLSDPDGGQGQARRAVQLEGLGAEAPEDSGGLRLLLQVLWKPLEE